MRASSRRSWGIHLSLGAIALTWLVFAACEPGDDSDGYVPVFLPLEASDDHVRITADGAGGEDAGSPDTSIEPIDSAAPDVAPDASDDVAVPLVDASDA
jgi:hypothetical protein